MSSKQWKKIRHWIEYAWIVSFQQVLGRLPLRFVLALAHGLGWLMYHVIPFRREVVLSNLARAFPEKSLKERKNIGRRTYQNVAKMMFEWIRFPFLSKEEVLSCISYQDIGKLDSVREMGRGALLMSGHFGNWELMGGALAKAGYPVSFLVLRQKNRRVDRFINDLRRSMGVKIIYTGMAGVREVFHALKNNEFVAILADQDAHKEGLFIEFLGQPTSVHKGPALFALKTGTPLVFGSAIRGPGGRHRVVFDVLTFDHLQGVTPGNVREITEAHARLLEEKIREYPDHWYWLHRRWKTKPPAGWRDDEVEAAEGNHD